MIAQAKFPSPQAPAVPGTPPLSSAIKQIRIWFYVYLLLLIFEGALRKWVFSGMPNVMNALLVVRDPVALVIYFLAARSGMWRLTGLSLAFACLTLAWVILGIVQGLLLGVNHWVVLYGLRTYALHLPLAFVMPAFIDRKELLRIGRWTLWLSIPMGALMAMQFLLPSDHFLNKGVGDGEQIRAAMGHIRPPGTFSYNNGAGRFFLIAAAFWLYSLVDRSWLNRVTRFWAAVAIVISIAVCGSRGFVVNFGIILAMALIGGHFSLRLWVAALRSTATLLLLLIVTFFSTDLVHSGVEAFVARWQEGAQGDVYDAIVMRALGSFTEVFHHVSEFDWLGSGLGMGSNVAGRLTIGEQTFLLAEDEWTRSTLEMGILVGLIWIIYRVALTGSLTLRSWRRLRHGDSLPWLLVAASSVDILIGFFTQATALGFIAIGTGLCYVALAHPPAPTASAPLHGPPMPRRAFPPRQALRPAKR